jgi:hypothetical protein
MLYRGQILLRHKIRRPLQAGLAWLTMRAISGDASDEEYELLKDIRHMRQVSSGKLVDSLPITRRELRGLFLECGGCASFWTRLSCGRSKALLRCGLTLLQVVLKLAMCNARP